MKFLKAPDLLDDRLFFLGMGYRRSVEMPLTLHDKENRILLGDSLDTLKTFPDKSADCCVTSPPYFQMRDYGVTGQIGIEKTPEEYIVKLSSIFREIGRVLKDEGTLWVNIGDSYGRGGRGTANTSKNNSKHNYHYNQFPSSGNANASKSLTAIPFRFALEMINNGWILRGY
jgi:DNA modification methylase